MPVFCFHASEGRGSSAASDSPLSVPMLAGLAAPVGLLMLAVSDVLVEAAKQLVPLAENCASSVLLAGSIGFGWLSGCGLSSF